jgi:hypothetical protein
MARAYPSLTDQDSSENATLASAVACVRAGIGREDVEVISRATLLNELELPGGRLGLQLMCEAGGSANPTMNELADEQSVLSRVHRLFRSNFQEDSKSGDEHLR